MEEAIPLLDAPARDGIESRRTESLARAEAEACVMPGAADSFTDNETLG
jgi:hypothetical protein